MASIRLEPPEPFDFRQPYNWPKWKRRIDLYRIASGLAGEGEFRQVNTIIYCLGEEAEDILASANLAEGARTYHAIVIQSLDRFLKARQNIIYERARFNQSDQLSGETGERYITVLYSLVQTCNYGALKEEMLPDRLEVGIADLGISEILQLDPDLTLEKAKKIVRQKKAVSELHCKLIGGGSKSDPIVLDQVRSGGGGRPLERRGERSKVILRSLGEAPRRPPRSHRAE